MSNLIAVSIREKSALALHGRERIALEAEYVSWLGAVARKKFALEMFAEMSDEEIVELDELVASKVSFFDKHSGGMMVASLAVAFSSPFMMPVSPIFILGFVAGMAGLSFSILRDNSDSVRFFAYRKRLKKLCGNNFLPGDAVRARSR